MLNENLLQAKKEKRIYYFDILRVIACLMVILTHVSSEYVISGEYGFNYWVGNVVDSASRVGVPLFVMISGALMLDEKYVFTAKKLLSHVVKIVIFFAFWSAAYSLCNYIILPLTYNSTVDFKAFVSAFFLGHYHLWYCFMIVGLYLICPLLRLWVKKANKKYVEYFLILALVFAFFIPKVIYMIGLIPEMANTAQKATIILNYINLNHVGGYVAYYILGWYIHNFGFKKNFILYILGGLSFIFTVLMAYITKSPDSVYDNISVNVLLMSVAIFVAIKQKYYCKEIDGEKCLPRFISFVSKYSLGIYGVHVFFIFVMRKYLFEHFSFNLAVVTIPVYFIVAFSLSLLVSFVISKIPYLKKVV